MKELVSVIMPSYNTAKYIEESINSVMAQTYTNWELIIVDDCSTDNTDEIISNIKDNRIRYIKNEKNIGAALSRNKALKEAKGEWIAFLDSDDLWMPTKLEEQLEYMKKNNYDFTYTDYRIKVNNKLMPYINIAPEVITKRRLYNYCYFSAITVIYNAKKIGLIQIADLKKNNDYAMWFQAIEKTNCYRFPKCLSIYVKHENSISSGSKIKLIKYHYYLFRDGLNKGRFVSFILTCNNLFFGVIKKIKYRKYIDD